MRPYLPARVEVGVPCKATLHLHDRKRSAYATNIRVSFDSQSRDAERGHLQSSPEKDCENTLEKDGKKENPNLGVPGRRPLLSGFPSF